MKSDLGNSVFESSRHFMPKSDFACHNAAFLSDLKICARDVNANGLAVQSLRHVHSYG